MAKKQKISAYKAKKVEKYFERKDDHSEAKHIIRTAISTEAGSTMRCQYYDGKERPAVGSSTIDLMADRNGDVWMVYLKSWPRDVQNPVAIFNDKGKAKSAVKGAVNQWSFLVK